MAVKAAKPAPAAVPRPLGGVRTAKREAVLAAATRLFMGEGYAGTSMDAVSAGAGVSKATVYAYFPSKEALFAAVIERHCERLVEPFGPSLERRGSVREQLLQVAEGFLDVAYGAAPLALYRVVIGEGLRFPDLARALEDSGPRPAMRGLEALLKAAVRKRALSIADIGAAVDQFFGMLLGLNHILALLGLVPAPSRKDLRALAARTVDMFLAVYGPGARKPAVQA